MDCPDQSERYHGGVIASRRQALGAHSRSERDSSLIDGLEQSGFIANCTIRRAGRRKLNDRSCHGAIALAAALLFQLIRRVTVSPYP